MKIQTRHFVLLSLFASKMYLLTSSLYAQGAYLSNLSRTPVGSVGIGNDAWFAQDFTTGTNSAGYYFDSALLSMDSLSRVPLGFSVFLYDNSGLLRPQSILATLAGESHPTSAGIYTYTDSDLVLSPSTRYWVVLTSQSPISDGAYNAQLVTATFPNYDAIEGWFMGRSYYASPDGLNWTLTRSYALQFAIDATAIPEPSSFGLLIYGGALWLAARGRRIEPAW